LTIGEGASEILRLAIAKNLATPGSGEDLRPSLENLEGDDALTRASLPNLWAPSLNALRLARTSFQVTLERIKWDDSSGDLAPPCQTTAVKIADLATKLWIAGQVTQAAARLANRRPPSEKVPRHAKSFVAKASLEVEF
jgi:hypothetical protein